MPVRKIPKSFRSVTGRFPSMINGRCMSYESKLERDYFLRLEFDPKILSYEEQPLKVPGTFDGLSIVYIPDCLVTYRDERHPLLVELKYEKELAEKADKLDRKFARLREYAAENEMEFNLVTEKDVYDTALENYRLIYRFAKVPSKFDFKKKSIIGALEHHRELSLKDLLKCLNVQQSIQAEYSPAVWHMLYTREIETDLNRPIGYDSKLRIYGQKIIF